MYLILMVYVPVGVKTVTTARDGNSSCLYGALCASHILLRFAATSQSVIGKILRFMIFLILCSRAAILPVSYRSVIMILSRRMRFTDGRHLLVTWMPKGEENLGAFYDYLKF